MKRSDDAMTQRPPPAARRLRRPLAGCALVAASLAAIGCGSSSTSPTILNTEKVERAIERSSLEQRGRHVHVSCPSGVHQKKGLVFNCTTLTSGTATRFVVTQLDGSGRVHYEAR